jgi:hypothetical protein
VRVPLLVRAGGIASRDARAISLIELPAMALAWAEDRPAVPAGKGDWVHLSMPSVVALPDQCDRTWTGLRSAGRKLVLGPDGQPWLFFDLEDDPHELRNLVEVPARRAELERLRQLLRSPR